MIVGDYDNFSQIFTNMSMSVWTSLDMFGQDLCQEKYFQVVVVVVGTVNI